MVVDSILLIMEKYFLKDEDEDDDDYGNTIMTYFAIHITKG